MPSYELGAEQPVFACDEGTYVIYYFPRLRDKTYRYKPVPLLQSHFILDCEVPE